MCLEYIFVHYIVLTVVSKILAGGTVEATYRTAKMSSASTQPIGFQWQISLDGSEMITVMITCLSSKAVVSVSGGDLERGFARQSRIEIRLGIAGGERDDSERTRGNLDLGLKIENTVVFLCNTKHFW
jgi:hypothetical protein